MEAGYREAGRFGLEYEQHGKLWYRSPSQIRLDIYASGRPIPFSCGQSSHRRWLVASGSNFVHLASGPIDPQASGWLGQMRAQLRQARVWAELLLARPGLVSGRAIEAIELAGPSRLRLRLTAATREETFFSAPLWVSLTLREEGPQIDRIETTSMVVEYSDWADTAGMRFPRRVEWVVRLPGGQREQVFRWRIEAFQPAPSLNDFERAIAPPRNATSVFPHLYGTVRYGPDGNAQAAAW